LSIIPWPIFSEEKTHMAPSFRVFSKEAGGCTHSPYWRMILLLFLFSLYDSAPITWVSGFEREKKPINPWDQTNKRIKGDSWTQLGKKDILSQNG